MIYVIHNGANILSASTAEPLGVDGLTVTAVDFRGDLADLISNYVILDGELVFKQKPAHYYVWSTEKNEWVVDRDLLKAQITTGWNRWLERALSQPYIYYGNAYSVSLSYINELSLLATTAAGTSAPIAVRTQDNKMVSFLAEELKGLVAALLDHRQRLYSQCWLYKDRVSSDDVTDGTLIEEWERVSALGTVG
jgi:hypothetical protein